MKKLIFLLLFLPLLVSAQAVLPGNTAELWVEKNGKSLFPADYLNLHGTEEQQVQQAVKYITDKLKSYFTPNTGLQLNLYKQSPVGTHISFTQVFLGVPIYGSDVKINLYKNGRVSSLLFKLAHTQNWPQKTFASRPDEQKIKSITNGNVIARTEKYWFYDGENPAPAWLIDYGTSDGLNHNEALISTENEVLYQLNKHRYSGEKDTMATGHIFYPDPLSSARKPYGAPYADFNDSAVFVLDYERFPVKFAAKFRNDSFYLQNKYAQIVETSAPVTPQTVSATGVFNFSRSQPGFEDVNVFAHIFNFRMHLQKIGFDTMGKTVLKVDAHALGGRDQSEFSFFQNDLQLLFGDGGIDDGEDADVIVHEYSHFLSYSASGDNAYGSDRLAIEEGMGDYFACSYSKHYSDYNWQKVFNWDGNETWDGRSCITAKNYKNDLRGNRYQDGEIWAGTLMEIQDEIGRNQTDALMLGTLYMLSKFISMPNAAKLLIHVDSALHEGRNFETIAKKFIKNGILPDSYLSIGVEKHKPAIAKINTAFFQSHNITYIEFDKLQSGVVKLTDLQGKEIFTQQFGNTNKLNVYAPSIKPGMYILNISANGVQQSVKLLK